ncbi:unnamed protein product [Cylicocyclus nassatus]|uniref:Uncharacterized protein n=1 Tax=Cylicocyclus nassatus TaxID=53992 RepID=A0AA36MAP3_CYLNA|nr:unnamed protein product [Cylicocyclus nassatus]
MAPMKARTRRHLESEVIGEDEENRLTRALFGIDYSHSNKAEMDCDKRDISAVERAQKCVWHDSDDDDCTDGNFQDLKQNLVSPPKKNKYQNHLRKMFERFYGYGTPKWARHTSAEKQSKEGNELEVEFDETVSKLTGSTQRYLDMDWLLVKGIIAYTRCPDVTLGHHDNRSINALLFHKVRPVVLTAGDSGKIQLFRVDERLANGNFLQNVQFSDFPITSTGFTQNGDAVICGSRRQRYLMNYHLEQGSVMQLNLPKSVSNQCPAHFTISNDGSLLAMIAQSSQVLVFSLPTMELVKRLSAPSEVSSLQFSSDSNQEIWALTERGEVIIWNFHGFQHMFRDEGAVHGTKIRLSYDGMKVACGSNTGIVNVYDVADVRGNGHPKPCTVASNLTTSCDSISFSHDSQIMAFSSRAKVKPNKCLSK